VLTVPRTSPVAVATSPAVIAPLFPRAASTLLLVAPGALRRRAVAGVGERVRVGPEPSVARAGGDAGRSRGSSAASAPRSFSASASSCSRRCWMSCRMRSIKRSARLVYEPRAILHRLAGERVEPDAASISLTAQKTSRESSSAQSGTFGAERLGERPHVREWAFPDVSAGGRVLASTATVAKDRPSPAIAMRRERSRPRARLALRGSELRSSASRYGSIVHTSGGSLSEGLRGRFLALTRRT